MLVLSKCSSGCTAIMDLSNSRRLFEAFNSHNRNQDRNCGIQITFKEVNFLTRLELYRSPCPPSLNLYLSALEIRAPGLKCNFILRALPANRAAEGRVEDVQAMHIDGAICCQQQQCVCGPGPRWGRRRLGINESRNLTLAGPRWCPVRLVTKWGPVHQFHFS